MPIASRTFTAVNGLDYIQHSSLAFATIYVVAREGTQYGPYIAGGPTYRTFIHQTNTGKLFFPNAFDGGDSTEKVFVLYKPVGGEEPEEPPGVCVPVSIASQTIADATDGQAYLQTITLTGTAPFVLSGITKPAWMTITNSGNTVTLTGTPGPGDVTALTLVEFDATNCSGGSAANFNQSIQVFAATVNFYIYNTANVSVQIVGILYIGTPWYTILTGSFPVNYMQALTGVQSGVISGVGVDINGIVFPQNLNLYKNGILQEKISVSVNGIETFAAVTFTSSDEMTITIT